MGTGTSPAAPRSRRPLHTLPPSAAITKREETSFDLWRCLLSTKGEGKKRNPFSINTLQVHSSNQAEAAVKNSSALLGLGTSCSEGAGSRQPVLQGHSGTGREQRRGAGQAVLGTGGSYVGMDRQGAPAARGAPAVRGAGQGVGCPTYVGPGWSGHRTRRVWGTGSHPACATCWRWGRAAGVGEQLSAQDKAVTWGHLANLGM